VKYPHRAGVRFDAERTASKLGILLDNAAEVNTEIEQLLAQPVTDRQWEAFVAAHMGSEQPKERGTARTKWDLKHDALTAMYLNDPRCSPWQGTAFGVVQAVNTFNHHEREVRGMSRPERNMLNMATGAWEKEDAKTLKTLQLVLAA